MSENFDDLFLDNQVCFALYVCSKEIIRKFKPHLEKVGLTYTSYITLLALWEKDNISVNELGSKLFLDSGTLTPLLKKMEKDELIVRTRSAADERTVIISLTQKALDLRPACRELRTKVACGSALKPEEGREMISRLKSLLNSFCKKS